MRDAFSGVADLDKAVVTSIGNATSSVIKSSTSGIAQIVSSLGGLSTIILWALVILLYLYEIARHRPDQAVFRILARVFRSNHKLQEIEVENVTTPPPPHPRTARYCSRECATLLQK